MSDTINIVCPQCAATNRIPTSRNAGQANCGRCHTPLFGGHPVELNAASFDKHIGNNDIPVLVDFWAPWCGPCKMMAPVFEQAARELEPGLRIAKVNTEAEQALAARFNIRSIPTLALFRGGREIQRVAGAMDLQNLTNWVRQSL